MYMTKGTFFTNWETLDVLLFFLTSTVTSFIFSVLRMRLLLSDQFKDWSPDWSPVDGVVLCEVMQSQVTSVCSTGLRTPVWGQPVTECWFDGGGQYEWC